MRGNRRGNLRMRPLPAALILLQQMLAYAVAAVSFWPIHHSAALAVAAGIAIVSAAVVAVLGAVFRWNASILLAATFAAYLLVGVPAAVPDQALLGFLPTVPGLADLVAGAALSWKQLLTISLPVGSYETLLVPVFLSVLVLGVTTMSVALRSRVTEAAVLGPFVVLFAGIVLGPRTMGPTFGVALVLLVLSVVFLTWVRTGRRQAAIRRANLSAGTVVAVRGDRRRVGVPTAVGALVILAVAVAGAGLAELAIPPGGPRDVLRAAIEKPFDPRDYPSPLSAYRTYVTGDAATRPELSVTGVGAGDRVALATLDTYDGVVYTVGGAETASASGTFSRVPFALDRSGVDGREVELDVDVLGYSGVWVPGAGRLESVDFAGPRAADLQTSYFYNDNSGTGAVLAGLRSGDSYTMRTVVPDPVTREQIPALRPGGASVPDLATAPDDLTSAVAGWIGDADTDGERLAAVLAGIREQGYISHGGDGEPFSASGHSLARIGELLLAQPMLGDAEQYAVTAALAARDLGFPARVVMGFVVPAEAEAGSAVEVTGADMSAWIEVNTAGRGWVALDPNPDVRDIPDEVPADATKVARPQSVIPPPPAQQDQTAPQAPPEVDDEQTEEVLPAWLVVLAVLLRVLGWILVALVLLLSPFLAIVAAKLRRRRRRRRSGTPLQRIAGAWAELTDAAVDRGIEPVPHATRYEVARAVGGRETLVLAAAVDRATFAPGEPGEADVERVWSSADRLRHALADGRTRWERISALVTTRSFLRNRRLGTAGAARRFAPKKPTPTREDRL